MAGIDIDNVPIGPAFSGEMCVLKNNSKRELFSWRGINNASGRTLTVMLGVGVARTAKVGTRVGVAATIGVTEIDALADIAGVGVRLGGCVGVAVGSSVAVGNAIDVTGPIDGDGLIAGATLADDRAESKPINPITISSPTIPPAIQRQSIAGRAVLTRRGVVTAT